MKTRRLGMFIVEKLGFHYFKLANFDTVHLYGPFFKGPRPGDGTHHRQKMKGKLLPKAQSKSIKKVSIQ